MLSSGGKKPRRGGGSGGGGEFRTRVLGGLAGLVLLVLVLVGWRTPPSGADTNSSLAAVRQQTQDFIQQYKQKLAEDFNQQGSGSSVSAEAVAPPVTTTKELLHPLSRPAVEVEAWRDPNAVVHKDSGPLPQVKKSFTTFSDLITPPTNTASTPSTNEVIDTKPPHSSPGVASRNVVIGMAQDTDPKNLVTFCASLRKHSQADVVLFMNMPISERNKEIVTKYNIRVIPFQLSDFSSEFQNYHPSTLRWVMMDNFFEAEENKDKYSNVWMIDVRDSMFQADPFDMIAREKSAFYTFKGVEDKSISQCGWNGGWIKDCFGQAKLNQVGNKNIICSGVSVGTIDVVLKYLKSMRMIVEGKSNEAKFPSCERNGVDQGIHNVLVHTDQIENIVIFNQATSPVLNLQARIASVDEKNGVVKNKAGKLAAVVHQYDRFPVLQKTLFEQYAYWIDFSDPMFEWNADAQCQRFEYVKDVDMFRGVCDYKIKGGMTGPNSCCGICAGLPDCSSFTFYQGQCFLKKGCTGKTKNKAGRLAGAVSAYYK